MTTLREAAAQALEALEYYRSGEDYQPTPASDAIAALRERLAQPEQEPVAWGAFYFGGNRNGKLYSHCDTQAQIEAYIADRHQSDDSNTFRAAPLYTSPPQRKPLTDDEICKLWDSHTIEVFGKIGINPVVFARYLERAHGIGERE